MPIGSNIHQLKYAPTVRELKIKAEHTRYCGGAGGFRVLGRAEQIGFH